ncbi:MAG: hypothetical protein A2Z51_02325 [Deltaproteobacteria bacterium RBG_19FT_COMBO_52_11]|nr:MAG: hypothetical protein A2Z51_02325 [Deltaproteobacteria bacterium RBG_19FT_COMBO_52_11]
MPERKDYHSMKKRRILVWGLFFGVWALSAGCAKGPHYSLVPDYKTHPPRSVAVLPVLNETVSLKAQDIFRPLIQKKLSQKGYETSSFVHIDERLLTKEIREAGQVHSLSPQELGKLLGVDALLYATVTDFSTTYLVAYASMSVGARFELKDVRTGEKLWDSEHRVKEPKLGLNQKFIKDTLSYAALQSYTPYCQKVVNVSFNTLPNGPLAVTAGPAPAGCLMPGGTK